MAKEVVPVYVEGRDRVFLAAKEIEDSAEHFLLSTAWRLLYHFFGVSKDGSKIPEEPFVQIAELDEEEVAKDVYDLAGYALMIYLASEAGKLRSRISELKDNLAKIVRNYEDVYLERLAGEEIHLYELSFALNLLSINCETSRLIQRQRNLTERLYYFACLALRGGDTSAIFNSITYDELEKIDSIVEAGLALIALSKSDDPEKIRYLQRVYWRLEKLLEPLKGGRVYAHARYKVLLGLALNGLTREIRVPSYFREYVKKCLELARGENVIVMKAEHLTFKAYKLLSYVFWALLAVVLSSVALVLTFKHVPILQQMGEYLAAGIPYLAMVLVLAMPVLEKALSELLEIRRKKGKEV